MARLRNFLPLCVAFMAGATGCGQKPVTLEELTTRVVILPNGTRIRAEVMTQPEDMLRGMMFRDALAPDRGMLFIHGSPGNYPYWMYQVRIPLDILWLDPLRRIVEMSPNTPPCTTAASQCPSYGGKEEALIVLELSAGSIAEHGLRVGDVLNF